MRRFGLFSLICALVFLSENSLAQQKPGLPPRKLFYFDMYLKFFWEPLKKKSDTLALLDFYKKNKKSLKAVKSENEAEIVNSLKSYVHLHDLDDDGTKEIFVDADSTDKLSQLKVYRIDKTGKYIELLKDKSHITNIERFRGRNLSVRVFDEYNSNYYVEKNYQIIGKKDSLKLALAEQMLILKGTERPSTYYALAYEVVTLSDSSLLRLTSEIKDEETNPVTNLKGNLLAIYPAGVSAKAIAYTVDYDNQAWFFVTIDSEAKSLVSSFPKKEAKMKDKSRLLYSGWMLAKHLKILKEEKKK